MGFSLFKHFWGLARWVPATAVLVVVAGIGVSGLGRSFWLDEAWVVNSLRANSLGEMFWGGEWLQTTPPLFLLTARAAVAVGGFSTSVLRSVPLVYALLAGTSVLFAARRVAPKVAPLIAAQVLFSTTALEYLHLFKQYAGETAAAAMVVWAAVEYERQPDRARYILLCLAMLGGVGLAPALAFLAPGIVLLVWRQGGFRPAAAFTGGFAAAFVGLYLAFLRPNLDPALWAYWEGSVWGAYTPGVWLLLAASAILALWFWRERRWALLASVLPVLLLAAVEWTGWYPASVRTRMFTRPGLLLALGACLEPWLARAAGRWLRPLAGVAAIAMAVNAAVTYRPEPFEAYEEAIALLRARVAPADLLLVHASAREGFRLHAALRGWNAPARYGETGWPCCPRGRAFAGRRADAAAVRADLDRLAPSDHRGRIWLLYTDRPTHWDFLGLDEGELWRQTLWARGCPPAAYLKLPNLIVAAMQCHSE